MNYFSSKILIGYETETLRLSMIPCQFRPLAEISGVKFVFSTHLSAIDNGWIPADMVKTLAFSTVCAPYVTSDHYFAVIFKMFRGKVRNVVVHIEEDAAEDVDHFMDAVLKEMTKLGQGLVVTFHDQSVHGEYTARKMTEFLKTHEIPEWWLPHNLYSRSYNESDSEDIVIKDGFTIQPLELKHTELIVKVHYTPPPGESFTQMMSLVTEAIKLRPCYGVFKENDLNSDPVAWIIMYDYTHLGGFRTLPDYRGNGFGRALIKQIVKSIGEVDNGFIVSAAIHDSNATSVGLFESEGFSNVDKRNPMMLYFGKSMSLDFNVIHKAKVKCNKGR